MTLIAITLLLILVGVVAYIYGAVRLSKYAFRVSPGLGVGVLLFPPLTLHFAIWKLEEEGKELPTALCMFGLVTTVMLTAMFWTPLTLAASGDLERTLQEDKAAETVLLAEPAAPAPTPAPEPVVEETEPTEEAPAEGEEGAEAAPAEGEEVTDEPEAAEAAEAAEEAE
ncbi:MAG: hypothetical protein ACNA8W_16070 [Bradymonadaceae bacterium]